MKNILQMAVAVATSLTLGGCGHVSLSYISKKETPLHKKHRERGYDLCHLTSCGPIALSNALKEFNINKTPFEVGQEIQDSDKSHYRDILGVFHDGFYEITCPPELKKYIRSQGLRITETKDINKVTPQSTAIFLLKGKNDLRAWHWITFPANEMREIQNYFDEHTKIKTIYILTR
jgi:hypothetical protein